MDRENGRGEHKFTVLEENNPSEQVFWIVPLELVSNSDCYQWIGLE